MLNSKIENNENTINTSSISNNIINIPKPKLNKIINKGKSYILDKLFYAGLIKILISIFIYVFKPNYMILLLIHEYSV